MAPGPRRAAQIHPRGGRLGTANRRRIAPDPRKTRFARPKLRAVRHVLQGEPDPHYMLRQDFNAGIATLQRFGFAYDILIYERHLPQTIQFVDRHPNQVFILDHIAKPRIRAACSVPGAKISSSFRSGQTYTAKSPDWSPRPIPTPGRKRTLCPISIACSPFSGPLAFCEYRRWFDFVSRFPDGQRAALAAADRRGPLDPYADLLRIRSDEAAPVELGGAGGKQGFIAARCFRICLAEKPGSQAPSYWGARLASCTTRTSMPATRLTIRTS